MEKGRREKNKQEKINNLKIFIVFLILIILGIALYFIINRTPKVNTNLNKEISKKIMEEDKEKLKSMEEVLEEFGGEVIEKPKDDTAFVTKDGKTYTVYQNGESVEGQIKPWTGEATEPAKDEAGNINIYTAEELKWIADQVISGNDNFKRTTITLRANIDLGARKTDSDNWDGNNWQAIIGTITDDTEENNEQNSQETAQKETNIVENEVSTEQVIENEKIEKKYENIKRFAGIFDGNGYSIRGLYINSDENYQGLFGYSTGTIKNLTIKNSYIKGSNGVGAIVGLNSGTIIDCNVENTIVIGTQEKTGGIVGITTKSSVIQNCKNNSKVLGNKYTGGIVGYANNNVVIKNCENDGIVYGTGYVGGIAGIIFYGSTIQDSKNIANIEGKENIVGGLVGYGVGQIENCYNYGNVTSSSFVGGIIGINYTMGNVIKCYNTGNIDGDSNIGGIVGINKGTVSSSYNTGKVNAINYRAGGICGQNSTDSYIYSCYNIGEIKAENNPGGIVGGDFGTITNCYYLNTIIKENNEQAKSEEELKSMQSELGDDFIEDTENINNGYPILSWQSNYIEDNKDKDES